MFSLGTVLLIKADLLKNFLITIGIFIISLVTTIIISYIWKKFHLKKDVK